MAVRMTTSGRSVLVGAEEWKERVSKADKRTGVLLLGLEETENLLANLTIGHLDIILGVTVVAHEGEEVIVRDIELSTNMSATPRTRSDRVI